MLSEVLVDLLLDDRCPFDRRRSQACVMAVSCAAFSRMRASMNSPLWSVSCCRAENALCVMRTHIGVLYLDGLRPALGRAPPRLDDDAIKNMY